MLMIQSADADDEVPLMGHSWHVDAEIIAGWPGLDRSRFARRVIGESGLLLIGMAGSGCRSGLAVIEVRNDTGDN
jgi:hypothetical protein